MVGKKRSYYKHTSKAIKEAILKSFPDAKPDQKGIERNKQGYILWMLTEIEQMDTTSKASGRKAARWIGWICKTVEDDLKLWDNKRSRELIRQDVSEKSDKAIK